MRPQCCCKFEAKVTFSPTSELFHQSVACAVIRFVTSRVLELVFSTDPGGLFDT